MENRGEIASKEEVVAKLKDDGDFDRLRLKIVRKLKDNEELREHIVSIVRQSAVLNRDGAENMKPRQLSDAIYEEVGDKVMTRISSSLWQIIRSDDDGMKSEITETVQSVYDKLMDPKGKKSEVQLSTSDVMPFQTQVERAPAAEMDDTMRENEPNEPPGFTLSHNHLNNHHDDHQNKGKELANVNIGVEGSNADQKDERHTSREMYDGAEDAGDDGPPGFLVEAEHVSSSDCGGDEDPDVPPGFG